MVRRLLVLLSAVLMMTFSGGALAAEGPPGEDPTCGAPGGTTSDPCPGDNGGPGCRGYNTARTAIEDNPTLADKAAEPALQLVESILEKASGDNDEFCTSDEQPGGGNRP